jgi:hypothetical protein
LEKSPVALFLTKKSSMNTKFGNFLHRFFRLKLPLQ